MADSYPVAAPTTARKEAAARMARKAYDKRLGKKTRADQVSAMRVTAAADAEVNAGFDKCVSWPGSCGWDTGTLAAMRVAVHEAYACVEARMVAFERVLERKGPVAAAAAGKGQTAQGCES
jgi:hypothetical protein